MEKKNHQILFSAAKLNHFILFTMMLTFYGTSISHGYSIDQAGRLRALWRAKKQTQGPTLVDDKWVVPSLSVEESSSSYDVGKMEDDLIEGGLPGQCLGSMMFKQYGGYVNVDSSKGQIANILFVESPAGVRFSYSNTTFDYKVTGDKRTGFYIPELADTIIKRNKEVDPILMIQLKGIMIGNGIMNDLTDDIGRLDYA
ncbi:hypothetical protein HYC85_009650 [Camellia sinensis]|uniref:Uncharacterized protein n=1 Tax=Camellia sinensis TaxID=4442 RepID=A0A7J7HIG1_CAMSI|nr:hypothetical protein HYC85_009650 [Camellia sinensis]